MAWCVARMQRRCQRALCLRPQCALPQVDNTLTPQVPSKDDAFQKYPPLLDAVYAALHYAHTRRYSMEAICSRLGSPDKHKIANDVLPTPTIKRKNFWQRLKAEIGSSERRTSAPSGNKAADSGGKKEKSNLLTRFRSKIRKGSKIGAKELGMKDAPNSDVTSAQGDGFAIGGSGAGDGGAAFHDGSFHDGGGQHNSEQFQQLAPQQTQEQVYRHNPNLPALPITSSFYGHPAYVYFDVGFSDGRSGRVVFELFGAALPQHCEQFRMLVVSPKMQNMPLAPINQVRAEWRSGR